MSGYLVPTSRELGELLRGFRKQRGWTQAQLAEHAGLLPKTVSAIEAGNGQVLLANVMRCLSALDVDLSLDSRTGGGAVPGPRPSGVSSSPLPKLRGRPDTSKPRPTATAEHVAVGSPAGSIRRKAKQAADAARPGKARRAAAGIKALEEDW